MSRCSYCGERAGFWSRMCADCKKLMACVQELRGRVGYGEFLDGFDAEVTEQIDGAARRGVPHKHLGWIG